MAASGFQLADFHRLSPNISLFQPPTGSILPTTLSAEQARQRPPALVILCTWLGGATTPRIAKYTTGYRALFPQAQILLIRTTILDITVRSSARFRTMLEPARDVVHTIGATHGTSILLHAFSHGGCNTAIQLAKSIHDAHIMFPLQAVVLDCCPGDGSFKHSYKALEASLPPGQAARQLGRVAIVPVVTSVTAMQSLGMMKSVDDMREELNDVRIFGPQARRLYLYSKADEMVSSSDVERHERQAAARGFDTRSVAFENSPHCALILVDATRYWAAIKDVSDMGRASSHSLPSKI